MPRRSARNQMRLLGVAAPSDASPRVKAEPLFDAAEPPIIGRVTRELPVQGGSETVPTVSSLQILPDGVDEHQTLSITKRDRELDDNKFESREQPVRMEDHGDDKPTVEEEGNKSDEDRAEAGISIEGPETVGAEGRSNESTPRNTPVFWRPDILGANMLERWFTPWGTAADPATWEQLTGDDYQTQVFCGAFSAQHCQARMKEAMAWYLLDEPGIREGGRVRSWQGMTEKYEPKMSRQDWSRWLSLYREEVMQRIDELRAIRDN